MGCGCGGEGVAIRTTHLPVSLGPFGFGASLASRSAIIRSRVPTFAPTSESQRPFGIRFALNSGSKSHASTIRGAAAHSERRHTISEDLKRNETDEKSEADRPEDDMRAYVDSELKEVSGGGRYGNLLVKDLNFTQGTDCLVALKQHRPREAWPKAQHMKGRVTPVEEIGGLPVNEPSGLEHEDDVMGSKDSAW